MSAVLIIGLAAFGLVVWAQSAPRVRRTRVSKLGLPGDRVVRGWP